MPQTAISDEEAELPAGPPMGRRPSSKRKRPSTASKRSEYVYQACIGCRKKKVKCSGDTTCVECAKTGKACVYSHQRRKLQASRSNPNPQPQSPRCDALSRSSSPGRSNQLLQMSSRLSQLETQYSWLQSFVSSTEQPEEPVIDDADSTTDDPVEENDTVSNDNEARPVLIHIQGQTQTPNPQRRASFNALPDIPLRGSINNHEPDVVGTHHNTNQNWPVDQAGFINGSTIDSLLSLPRIDTHPAMPPTGTVDLLQALKELSMNNGAAHRPMFDIFFHSLNPLHPLINENQFRAEFDRLVFDQVQLTEDIDIHHAQFLALVFFVLAEVKMLNGSNVELGTVCGWPEYSTADSILADAIWKNETSLITLQCLVLKTRYLCYLQKLHQARDSMAIAVRICLQLRLHDKSWIKGKVQDPFTSIMHQRVFWCVFTMERCVSMSSGMPPVLRTSDFVVDLPEDIDDRSMFPGRPLPNKTPASSFNPYFRALIRWAELWEVIWNNAFCTHRALEVSEQTLLTIDAQLEDLLKELPQHLQWPSDPPVIVVRDLVEPWIWRQRIFYITRVLSLRLLTRQEIVLKMGFRGNLANEMIELSARITTIIAQYLRLAGQSVDRYFLITYLMGLIVPLSFVICKPNITPNIFEDALRTWGEVRQLTDEISPNCPSAQPLLQRLEGLIKIVDSFLASARLPDNSSPGQAQPEFGTTGNNNQSPSQQPRDIDASEITFSFLNGISASNIDPSLASSMNIQSPSQFLGLACDPLLWRVTTW